MSRPEIAERAAELRRARVPYVRALVVLAERPTSAKPGDEAIVLGDGTIEGFVGGTCAEVTVRAQSLALLDSGESVLLRITPLQEVPEPEQPGRVTVVNECLSGGTFEVFLEPVMPALVLEVVGESPLARALARIGAAIGYEVGRFGAHEISEVSAVVVASHGRDEESTLAAAVRAHVPYVGLVASRRRGAAVLAELDVADELKALVHSPAGLDLGARTPEEVAVSILAEIVQSRPRPTARAASPAVDDHDEHDHDDHHDHAGQAPAAAAGAVAVDPVCGMSVAMVDASLHYDLPDAAGTTTRYWFCGSGCLRAFADDPASYLRTDR